MVKEAVEGELKKLPEEIQKMPEAQAAILIAQAMDISSALTPQHVAQLNKALLENLDRLRSLAPGEEEEDQLAQLRARIADRSAAT